MTRYDMAGYDMTRYDMTGSGYFFFSGYRKFLDSVISRENICGRAASLACHILAQCAGAGTFNNHPLPRTNASDGMARRVCKTLREVIHSDPTKWEVGQVCNFGDFSLRGNSDHFLCGVILMLFSLRDNFIDFDSGIVPLIILAG